MNRKASKTCYILGKQTRQCNMASTLVQNTAQQTKIYNGAMISSIHRLLAKLIYYVDQRLVVSRQRLLLLHSRYK